MFITKALYQADSIALTIVGNIAKPKSDPKKVLRLVRSNASRKKKRLDFSAIYTRSSFMRLQNRE